MNDAIIRRGACILAVLLGVCLFASLFVPDRGTFAVDGAKHVYNLRMPRVGSGVLLVLLLIVIYAAKQAVRFARWTGGGIMGLFTRSGPSVGSTANTEPTAVPIVRPQPDEFIPEIKPYQPPVPAAVLTQDVSPAAGLDAETNDRLTRIEMLLESLATHYAASIPKSVPAHVVEPAKAVEA